MASSFKVARAQSTVQLVGATDTRDVQQVWITTSPHGVTFPLYVAENQYTAAVIQGLGESYSATIERWFSYPYLTAVYYRQDVAADGSLVDNFVFVIASSDGLVTKDVIEPVGGSLVFGNMDAVLAPQAAELDAIAAL